jgi:putative transposase
LNQSCGGPDRGITEQTFYRWRKKYGGVEPQDLKRMKELEKENSRLKRIVGELALDVAALKELNAKKW